MKRYAFTLLELCVVLLLMCILCLGLINPLPLAVAGNVLCGWAFFLYRVIPRIQVQWSGVLTAGICLAVLAVGLHLFLGWLARSAGCGAAAAGAADWTWRRTFGVLGLIVSAFAAGIGAIGVAHQASWLITSPERIGETVSPGVRDAAARTQSGNNLKQMGLAFLKHHDTYHRFPHGGEFDVTGRALHGWQTTILPYIEEAELYRTIDVQRSWNDPANAAAFGTVLKGYLHPLAEPRTADGFALSHYAANARVLGGDRAVTLEELNAGRGAANTILLGEAAGDFKPWGHPANWRDPARGLNRSSGGFGSPAGKGPTQLMMADGSVRSFSGNADPEFLKLLAGPAPAGATPHHGDGKESSR